MMKIARTAPDALKILWKEKGFLKPKDVKMIEGELEKRGYNFNDKNLMMALKSSKFLTRKGEKGNYLYVQKYPYIEDNENGSR
jgi:repressor of nif and glnA expression